MSCVDIRGCRIGEGRPKVILPIVERAEAAILEKAAQFSTLQADCVEWRVDYFEGARAPGAVARCLAKMRVILRDKLLLVTIRTKAEGGQVALSPAEYRQFLELVLDTDCADLLDIEFFTAGADLPKLVEQAHSAGVAVVCSSHDFAKTPPRAELVCRMVQMQQAGHTLVEPVPSLVSRPAQVGGHAPVPHRCTGAAGRYRRDGRPSPGNTGHHHEHGHAGRGEPSGRGGLWLCHDLCQPRAGKCTGAGIAEHRK